MCRFTAITLFALTFLTVHGELNGLFKVPSLEPITLSPLPNFFRAPDYCIPKLKREFKENDTYFDDVRKRVESNDIAGAYDAVYAKATEMCTTEQVERMKALEKKYATIRQGVEALAPEYNKQTKDQVLQWLRDDNFMALSGFLVTEGMNALIPDQYAQRDKELAVYADLASTRFHAIRTSP